MTPTTPATVAVLIELLEVITRQDEHIAELKTTIKRLEETVDLIDNPGWLP